MRRRGVSNSYHMNSPRWSASATKGEFQELLKDRAAGHNIACNMRLLGLIPGGKETVKR